MWESTFSDRIIINSQYFAIIFLSHDFLAHSSLCALHIPLRLEQIRLIDKGTNIRNSVRLYSWRIIVCFNLIHICSSLKGVRRK